LQVKDRRPVRFETIEQALADAQAITVAANDGRLRRLGNWSVGQTFGHIAAWINYAFDGYPGAPSPEFAAAARPRRDDVLTTGMIPGVRFGAGDGTWGTDDLLLADGHNRLRNAWARLRRAAPEIEHPLFGDLSHSDWIRLNLRHSELHQSFFVIIGIGERR
jgi:hypothetical protein